jgi:hypothetical protein
MSSLVRCRCRRIMVATCAALPAAIGLSAADPARAAEPLAEARQLAAELPHALLGRLQEQIAQGGPEGAVSACQVMAPKMARDASERTGWAIRRVSLKPRNPRAEPDEWERAALLDFDRRAAAGQDPKTLEHHEVLMAGASRELRYIKALPVQPMCLACHGDPSGFGEGLAARLREVYPQDRATGYRVGEIRGAITLRRVLAAE